MNRSTLSACFINPRRYEMIYTITVNPTVDVTNTLKEGEHVEKGKTHRPEDQQRHAGGKGIDVSRVIRNLGGRSIAMGFLGGFTGKLVKGMLLEDGLELDFVDITQETRTNVVIIEKLPGNGRDKKEQQAEWRYNSPGPKVQSHEFLELYEKVESLSDASKMEKPTYVAICGSPSKDMKATAYVAFLRCLEQMDAEVALDTSGDALIETLRYRPRPDIVKPNADEFCDLMGEKRFQEEIEPNECGKANSKPSAAWAKIFEMTKRFQSRYPEVTALITLGRAGILLLRGYALLHATQEGPKQPEVKCSVGAGDSALAALIYRLDNSQKQGWGEKECQVTDEDWADALKWAVATASASVECPGTESPKLDEIQEFLEGVEVHDHSDKLESTPNKDTETDTEDPEKGVNSKGDTAKRRATRRKSTK